MKLDSSLFAATHRVMFLGGTVQALLTMAYWSLHTGAHYAGLFALPVPPLLTLLPASMFHALLLGSGVFPWFVFGFILTAGPRWQGAGELNQRDYLPPFLFLATGWIGIWAALFVPGLLSAAIALALAGWMLVLRQLWRIAMCPAQSREHIGYVGIASALGCTGLACHAVAAMQSEPVWGRVAIALTIWGFLLPVFATVAHRMLPFFSSAVARNYVVRRPAWALRVVLASSAGHGLLYALDLSDLFWIPDLPAMVAAAALSRVWWHPGVLGNRMVSVLHVSFAWVAPAFALSAAGSIFQGFGGQAPLHALTLGFFASMLVGMVTRVTLGHSGRPVQADAAMWNAFCLMQAAAVVRVLADLPFIGGGVVMLWASSLLWLAAFGRWAVSYAPALWRPRADGRPG